jgi:hypothetical protein
MAAQFKSNVRLREEKGFGSVSMKRLIFCGVGAVIFFMVLRLTPLASIALPTLLIVFILLLVLTGSRGGLPLWQRLLLGLRGSILLAAARHPDGLAAQVAQLLSIDPSQARLQADSLFETQSTDAQAADLSDWVVYADLREAEASSGLQFVTFGEASHGESL